MRKRGFTLIEMITVIAITAILMGIILVPLVQSFNFTRSAEGFANSQQLGRQLIEQITREIANSAGVRDNDGLRGSVAVVVPGWDGTDVTLLAEFSKLDIYKPAQGDPSNIRNGAFVDGNGVADPTLKAPVGDVTLPVTPGMTIVRYYVSLKNPLDAAGTGPGKYYNPYVPYKIQGNNRWQVNVPGDDNLYTLHRCEVQPYVFANGAFSVNTKFFADDNADGVPDYDDPYFMSLDAPPPGPVLTPAQRLAKIDRIKNWIRSSTIVSDFRRTDMIQPIFDKNSLVLQVNGNLPRFNTLIQFRPASITNEPAEASTAIRLNEETDAPSQIAPDVFKTRHPAWSAAIVREYPSGYDPNNNAANDYLIGRFDVRAGVRAFRIYHYDPDNDVDNDDRNGDNADAELFDVQAYRDQASKNWVFPLTRAITASDGRSGWLGNAALRARFTPFLPDLANGRLLASFGINEWGIDDPTGSTPPPADNNLPSKSTGAELTPTSDPAPPGNFYDPLYQNDLNRQFDKIWFDNPSLRVPGGVHRFIDLRVTPQADGTQSPLHPDPAIGFAQAQLVPGSDTVYGPDQNPGPNYGNLVRYMRVTRNPGRNQYKINYVNLPEPDWAALGYPAPPAAYDPTNFVSAVLQPRYKAGYVQLNSSPDLALPGPAPISVFYRVQFIRPGDTLTVDYDTRQLINILLTIRNYPPSTAFPNPQTLTLQGAASVRNYQR